jgi:hypothetical protein
MITNFKIFEQYIKEAITTDVENLLNSINDKKVDFYSIGLSNDDYVKERIEDLYDDADFNKQLFKKNLKKGEIESTLEIENFLRKDIDMKFFFLYDRNDTVINNPEFLILQYYESDKWKPIEIYKIKGNVKSFYEKLTAKEIKLIKNNTTYIYQTSNSGNNWILKDKDKKTVEFKENLENDEIKELIKSGAKLKIID